MIKSRLERKIPGIKCRGISREKGGNTKEGEWGDGGNKEGLEDNRAGRASRGEITRLLHPLRGRERLGAFVDPGQTCQAISPEI